MTEPVELLFPKRSSANTLSSTEAAMRKMSVASSLVVLVIVAASLVPTLWARSTAQDRPLSSLSTTELTLAAGPLGTSELLDAE